MTDGLHTKDMDNHSEQTPSDLSIATVLDALSMGLCQRFILLDCCKDRLLYTSSLYPFGRLKFLQRIRKRISGILRNRLVLNHKAGFLCVPSLECDPDAVVDGKSVVCASEQLSVSQ